MKYDPTKAEIWDKALAKKNRRAVLWVPLFGTALIVTRTVEK